jgi:hypothetical protein
MTGILSFHIGEVRVLFEHAKKADLAEPCYEDLFNPEYYHGNKIKYGKNNWPEKSAMNLSKIPKGLWLVKDHGCYLMPNSSNPLLAPGSDNARIVCYAVECDPSSSDDYWEVGQQIMGADDVVLNLPLAMFEQVMAEFSDDQFFEIKVTEDRISVMVPYIKRP